MKCSGWEESARVKKVWSKFGAGKMESELSWPNN